MKRARTHFLFILVSLFFPLAVLHAQDPEKRPEVLRADAEGTHFIVGFMQNEENRSFCAALGERGMARQRISIASRVDNEITLIYPDGSRIERSVSADQPVTFNLDGEQYECLGEGICDKSFEIIAEKPVSVYCLSSKALTTDGYLALPVNSWGTEYITANYNLDFYTGDSARDPQDCSIEPRRGEFAIIAAEDNTTVTVYPAARTASGSEAGEPMTRTLRKGEIWQIQDGGTVRGGTDLTGSKIEADKPVGVLSGHERAAIPWRYDTKNHLIEMLPPMKSHGTRHVIVPFGIYGSREGGDIVRIISVEDGITEIGVTEKAGKTQYQISGAGTFKELLLTNVSLIESDRPVLVVQYSQSNGVDIVHRFDPYMIVMTPEEQFTSSSLFQTMPDRDPSGRVQFDQHYLTVVMERDAYGTLLLNDMSMIGHDWIRSSEPVPGLEDEYIWMTFRLPGGQAFHLKSKGLFGGYVYGIGEFDSYGWPIGSSTADNQLPNCHATLACGGNAYTVMLTDSSELDYGLFSARIDPAVSYNVGLNFAAPLKIGSPAVAAQVALVDPTANGSARLIVEDLAGNITMLDLVFEAAPPAFSRDSINVRAVPVGVARSESLGIDNPNSRPIRLDSVRLKIAAVVTIDGLGSGGAIGEILNPGAGKGGLMLTVKAARKGSYRDTLVVYADCYTYEIPIVVQAFESAVSIANLDFGQVLVENIRCMPYVVRNSGTANVAVMEISLEGPFTIDPASMPSLPFTLAPGDSVVVLFCFTPEQTGKFIGTIRVTTSIGTATATVEGTGVDVITSVRDGREESSITVVRQGNSLLLDASERSLLPASMHLVALNGESIAVTARQEGAGRYRVEFPSGLPSGAYYLRAKDGEGKDVTAKVMIVR